MQIDPIARPLSLARRRLLTMWNFCGHRPGDSQQCLSANVGCIFHVSVGWDAGKRAAQFIINKHYVNANTVATQRADFGPTDT